MALGISPILVSPLVAIHLSPILAGGVRLCGCLQFMCLPLVQVICLTVWLVVSDVSYSCVFPASPDYFFACLPPCVFPVLWIVQLSGCLASLDALHVLPFAHSGLLAPNVSPSFRQGPGHWNLVS